MVTVHFSSVEIGQTVNWLEFDAVFRNSHFLFKYCGTELDVGSAPIETKNVERIRKELLEITGPAPYDGKIQKIKVWVEKEGSIRI